MSKRYQEDEGSQELVSSVSKRKKVQHEGEDGRRSYPTASTRMFSHDDYTVGWICAIPLEMAAARAMLDNSHTSLPIRQNDHNTYTLGRIGEHNVVVTCLPSGVYGTTSATTVASQMLSTFRSIRFGLMVGIGGGAPSKESDIRLGDVVVSNPTTRFGGVVQYDYGETVKDGHLERTGTLNKPPPVLLTAVARLEADHKLRASRIPFFLSEMVDKYPLMEARYTHRGRQQDRLFEAEYDHNESDDTCDGCDASKLVVRSVRSGNDPMIHYGLIASGNQVMKHGRTRNQWARELGILCFETEAAGLMDDFPCLVVRGISDYADSHKNKQWQEYAAATAAAYTKELLSVIPASQVTKTPTAATAISNPGESLSFWS
jgi:nucleoside phosphorylase